MDGQHERPRRSDAELILAVVNATAEWQTATELETVVKPLRELIWAVWEAPRLPRGRVRGKYPMSVQWSAGARRSYREDPGCSLVLDHLTPAAVIVRDLVRRPPRSPAALVRTLRRRIQYVVLNPEENRRLVAARVGKRLAPGSSDPWERYRLAGIDVAQCKPLAPPGN